MTDLRAMLEDIDRIIAEYDGRLDKYDEIEYLYLVRETLMEEIEEEDA